MPGLHLHPQTTNRQDLAWGYHKGILPKKAFLPGEEAVKEARVGHKQPLGGGGTPCQRTVFGGS